MASKDAQRRIISVVQRVESEPRTYTPPRRTPRLSGGTVEVGLYWCQLTGSLSGATGTWPAKTAGTISGQSVYQNVTGTLTIHSSSITVYNWFSASFAAGKTSLVRLYNNGTADILNQDC